MSTKFGSIDSPTQNPNMPTHVKDAAYSRICGKEEAATKRGIPPRAANGGKGCRKIQRAALAAAGELK